MSDSSGGRHFEPVLKHELFRYIVKITGAILDLTVAIEAMKSGDNSKVQEHLAEATTRVRELHEMLDTLTRKP